MPAGDISKGMLAVVRARIGDLAGTIRSDAEIYGFLNTGFRLLAQELNDAAIPYLTKVQSASLTGAQNAYNLPADFLRERIVKYKGLFARRWRLSETEALRTHAFIVKSETEPYYRIWNKELYFEVGTVSQVNGDTYELWYIKIPTAISAAADPELPKQYFDVVEDLAVSLCMEPGRQVEAARFFLLEHQRKVDLIDVRFDGGEPFDDLLRDPSRPQEQAGG